MNDKLEWAENVSWSTVRQNLTHIIIPFWFQRKVLRQPWKNNGKFPIHNTVFPNTFIEILHAFFILIFVYWRNYLLLLQQSSTHFIVINWTYIGDKTNQKDGYIKYSFVVYLTMLSFCKLLESRVASFASKSQPEGPGLCIYVSQWEGDPVIPPGTGLLFRRLLRFTGLRWRCTSTT